MITSTTYKKEPFIHLAKRHNNKKRPYLLVNSLQGKHIPVAPHKSFALFKELSKILYSCYPDERLLIIGFAETATAIGAAIAMYSPLDTYYIHTTRELLEHVDYLYFTESHSHATEQKLVCNLLEDFITKTDRIVFVEDEVTTGNTILNLIHILNTRFSHLHPNYAIASILNSMEADVLNAFKKSEIPLHFLLHLEPSDYTEALDVFSYENRLITDCTNQPKSSYSPLALSCKSDPRLGINCNEYKFNCDFLASTLLQKISLDDLQDKNVLVLGTEEFMFPPLYFANKLEQSGICHSVLFHATTRSPISPSKENHYPINSGYILNSFYEDNRMTYIYNLASYDTVMVLSDSSSNSQKAIDSISYALKINNCNKIIHVKWGES